MKCDPHHERCSELEAVNAELLAALEAVLRESDRNTIAYENARAAIKRAKEE